MNENQKAKQIHKKEQMIQHAIKEISDLMYMIPEIVVYKKAYYDECIKRGFNEDQALFLTSNQKVSEL